MSNDIMTTMGGAAAGMAMLETVKWELIPYGECVKLGVALALAVGGYLLYRGREEK